VKPEIFDFIPSIPPISFVAARLTMAKTERCLLSADDEVRRNQVEEGLVEIDDAWLAESSGPQMEWYAGQSANAADSDGDGGEVRERHNKRSRAIDDDEEDEVFPHRSRRKKRVARSSKRARHQQTNWWSR